jgi:hypothetical protein
LYHAARFIKNHRLPYYFFAHTLGFIEMWFGLLVMGTLAGVASGMFGIGGGVIIVPALMLLGFSQIVANGTSLAALLLPVGVFGALSYHRNGLMRWRAALIIAAGLFFGGWVGARIANSIDPTLLLRLYGAFLLYVGWRMAAPLQFFGLREPVQDHEGEPRDNLALIVALGLLAGVASGMFGIGGGAVIVPVLVTFLNFPQKVAVATSLGALLPPVGGLGALEYYKQGNLELGAALPVALGLLIGAWFGARITIGLPSLTVKRLYGVFLLVIGLRFLGVFALVLNLF